MANTPLLQIEDVEIVYDAAILAVAGIAMHALPIALVSGCLAAAGIFAVVLDCLKVPVFRLLKIA